MKIVRFVIALALAGGVLGALAAPASAFPPGVPGSARINSTVFTPGQTVTVTVQDTTPGTMQMAIFSAPVVIGTGTVKRNGTGSVSGQIPAGYSGQHTIQVAAAGGEVYTFAIAVSTPTPPHTTTCGGLASTGPIVPQTDRHTVQYNAGRHCDGPAGTVVTAALTIGSWSASRDFVIGDSGQVDVGGAFTDSIDELPLGESWVSVQVTPHDGSQVFVDEQHIVVITSQFGSIFCRFGGGVDVSWSGTNLSPGTPVVLSESGQTTIDTDTADASGHISLLGVAPTFGRPVDLQIIVFGVVVDETTTPVPFDCGAVSTAGLFRSVAPARVLDTRTGNGAPKAAVAPGATVTVQLTGRGGLPSTGVAAVVMNTTVTDPTGTGYISVYPAGGTRPVVSCLNFVARQTVPNAVTVPVSSDGKVTLFNGSSGTVALVADVSGYFVAGTPTEAGAFTSVAPTRILDTRDGTGAPRATVPSLKSLTVQVPGRGGVPTTGVASVVMNVTVTNPTGTGFVTAYAAGTTRPTASNLNFVPGQTAPNAVTVPVSDDGKVTFYNGSSGSLNLLADISGYYLAGTPTQPGAFVSLTPARVLDTRDGTGVARAAVPTNGAVTVQLAGRGGLPTTGIASVVLNVTATNPTGTGYVTVYPSGGTRPVVSSLNFVPGQTIPNAVTVPTDANGRITLFNGSGGSVDLLADVAGWYRS